MADNERSESVLLSKKDEYIAQAKADGWTLVRVEEHEVIPDVVQITMKPSKKP